MNRRDFVRLMGLAGGASALTSCGLERQTEKIIPYLVPPDDGVIPGVATYTNTTCTECPAGCGASVKTVDYRAGKLEGVASHPVNDGALCMRGQASISRLYHPDRLKVPMRKDADGNFIEVSWDEAYETILSALKPSPGFGFKGRKSPATKHVFLSGRTSGTLSGLIGDFCDGTGVERLPEFEMCSYAAIRKANEAFFGLDEVPFYRIEDADFLLTLGADLFETFVSPVSNAAQFARAKRNGHFKWTHVEAHASLTGFQAEHRYGITPGSEPYLLTFLLRKVSRMNVAGDRHIADVVESLPKLTDRGFAEKTGLTVDQLDGIAARLLGARKPLLIAGGVSTTQGMGFETALLAGLLQWATGMIGTTVDFDRAEDYGTVGTAADLQSLSGRLERGGIGVLFLAAVDASAGGHATLGLEHVDKAGLTVAFAEFMNATAAQCDVVLPLSDTLESWGDATPKRDLVSVIQPAVEPVHDTRTIGDILLQLLARRGATTAASYQQFLFKKWRTRYGERDTEKLITDGFLSRPAPARTVTLDRAAAGRRLRTLEITDTVAWPLLVVTPSIRAFDGRSSDLPLLSEIPDPLTTISWGAWISVSEADASSMGLREKDEVKVALPEWEADLPVKIQQGLPRGVMTIQFGSVRPVPVTVDPRTGGIVTAFEGATIRKTGRSLAVAVLSGSQSQEGRGVIPVRSREGEEHHHDTSATLYPENEYPEYRWGMAIDLDLCVGCGACASACYVENNVPVVGREQHLLGREMSWLRIEPYNDGHEHVEFQPMMCQQCTNAPCESVCPVYATYHNPEGINAQVYNRCVGTRYCANNCPYKVRRFNWYDRPAPLNLTRNPEVSVRGRGVMEKCTFCVQRVRSARDAAKDRKSTISDGEVTTACAQTCPTQAVVFGSLKDEGSRVHQWAQSKRAYRVFESLGTGPGVYYLRRNWDGDHA
ncbi:MAG: 4Fe-4S dicluster domain-containing protein [Candidatus Krumholzibacteriia bacterium]